MKITFFLLNLKYFKRLFFLFCMLLCSFLCGCSKQPNSTIKYGNGEFYDSSGYASFYGMKVSEDAEILEVEEADLRYSGVGEIVVSVIGEVACPGVYILPEGARVFELVNMAGGVNDNADVMKLNMAAELSDGIQINIPAIAAGSEEGDNKINSGGVLVETTGIVSNDTGSQLVNINQATKAELMSLTGIGATRAQAIIAYREANGPFKSIEEVMNVTGIKEGTFNGFKDRICVR